MSLGSEGQNWRTAPPLASGHLNERSAPGGTGSPRSIFRRGSRNPEDRKGRQKRGKDKQYTEREENRLVKEVEAGTGDSTLRLASVEYGEKRKKKDKDT